jgi:hypothetical protein
MDILKSTPAARIPKWRSTLKRAILIRVNHQPVATIEQLQQAVQKLREQRETAQLTFATVKHHGAHPVEGSQMLYYDQLNIIGQYFKNAWRKARYKMLDSYVDQ